MREIYVYGEILEKEYLNIALFDILDIANAISRKLSVLEARNF